MDPGPLAKMIRSLGAFLLVLFGAATAAAESPRMRGEFEHHEALMIGCANLLFHHQKTLLELTAAVDEDVPILGIVSNRAQADSLSGLLTADGLAPDRITPVFFPTRGMWIRDYGPLFVNQGNRLAIVDPRYKVDPDDGVPTAMAEQWGFESVQTPLWAEGGQLVHNGEGLLLVSTALARLNAAHDGVDGAQIQRRLQQSLPFREAHWVDPLPGEPTGHLDMFMVFIGPDRLVVAELGDDAAPEVSSHLDATAARMREIRQSGAPLEVLRLPTPAPRNGTWFTYTNVILIANQVLVPQYAGPGDEANRSALRFWRRALPDREVIGIDSSSIIRRNGSLHCISLPIPVLPNP
jgi:agmatine/peptidylarginine deiminase